MGILFANEEAVSIIYCLPLSVAKAEHFGFTSNTNQPYGNFNFLKKVDNFATSFTFTVDTIISPFYLK